MESKKKYLVTGGAGFVGSNIAKTLEAQCYAVWSNTSALWQL